VEPRPTMQSVAERAGVSRQTVSNVLNAPHRVRPETLARVQSVIDEIGYRPHRVARQLRTRRSQVVGLRVRASADGFQGAVMDRFLHAMTEHAQTLGYRIMIFAARDDREEIEQYDELLDTVEIDAFVVTDTHHDDARTRWLAEHGIPFVTFGRPWDQASSASAVDHAWVDVDGAAGTAAAVEHLRALGHRRIGFIGWPEGSDAGDDRRRGWREAMAALALPPDELDALHVGVVDTIANGAQAAAHLLERSSATAFVCASDTLALGALAATRAGPDPMMSPFTCAVVGFDDTPVARAVELSSVAQPLHEAAGWALRLLLEQLGPAERRGDTPAVPGDHHVLLAPDLVVRASSVAEGRSVGRDTDAHRPPAR
jgi:DNA-binding LacI/PurR family transcriptional regulator